MKTARLLSALVAAILPWACADAPATAPPVHTTVAADAYTAGVEKVSITGTMVALSDGPPVRVIVTPSGNCRYWDFEGFAQFEGDVQGPVTFHRQLNTPCDGSHPRGSGLVEGSLTWNGRSGPVLGQWTTNCKPDDSPDGVACDGTMNFRGSDGLDGVQIHTKWGPGYWPFSYTGTVISN